MTPDQTRAQFEAFWATSGRHPALLTKRANGSYMAPICQAAWEAFQAAMSTKLSVNDEMVERAAECIRDKVFCCGAQLGHRLVYCNHPDLEIIADQCDCHGAARAVLTAALGEAKDG